MYLIELKKYQCFIKILSSFCSYFSLLISKILLGKMVLGKFKSVNNYYYLLECLCYRNTIYLIKIYKIAEKSKSYVELILFLKQKIRQ